MAARFNIIVRQFLFLFLIYSAFRVLFFFYHFTKISEMPSEQIMKSFLSGMRFDISTILLLQVPFILYFLIAPLKMERKWDRVLDKIIFGMYILLHSFFFTANFADTELILFSGSRLTYHFFAITKDIAQQFAQMTFHYWYLALPLAFLLLLFTRFTPWALKTVPVQISKKMSVAICFAFLLLIPLGIRGGLQNKPLKPAHAFVFKEPLLGHLTLNSSFSILMTRQSQPETLIKWFSNDEVDQVLKMAAPSVWTSPFSNKQNVVLIIMESFALEYIGAANGGHGYTPFFDELAKKSLFFRNGFANGRRSIEAVPSILAGLPSLLRDAFLTSNYQGVRLTGLPQILEQNGYQTAFFHGAENGSMFFDSFSSRVGVQHYFGLNEYPNKDDYDGFWGVLDEPFFQFAVRTMSEFQKPFFSTVFSLSSHQPYTVPPAYKGRFPKGELEIHESLGYADYALREFFKSAEKTDWYQNTFFILTGDHTSKSAKPEYQDTMGVYRVPIVIFHPRISDWNKVDSNRVVQHADIFPTALDLVGVSKFGLPKTGQSVFSTSDGLVVNRFGDRFWYRSGDIYIEMMEDKSLEPYRVIEERIVPIAASDNKIEEHKNRFKAFVQTFINGILTDSIGQ